MIKQIRAEILRIFLEGMTNSCIFALQGINKKSLCPLMWESLILQEQESSNLDSYFTYFTPTNVGILRPNKLGRSTQQEIIKL